MKMCLASQYVHRHSHRHLDDRSLYYSLASSLALSSFKTTLCTVSDDVYSAASTLHHRLYCTVASVSYAHMTVS